MYKLRRNVLKCFSFFLPEVVQYLHVDQLQDTRQFDQLMDMVQSF